MLAVTVTFEKRGRSFERLLQAPIPLNLLMLAKTSGAIVMGAVNAFVPVAMGALLADLSQVAWAAVVPAVILIAVSSTFLGLFIAVSVSEVFEAQTFSNFFRFPMVFLCGLFFPIERLPTFLQPLSYVFPLTYGVDILHRAFVGQGRLPLAVDLGVLLASCVYQPFVDSSSAVASRPPMPRRWAMATRFSPWGRAFPNSQRGTVSRLTLSSWPISVCESPGAAGASGSSFG